MRSFASSSCSNSSSSYSLASTSLNNRVDTIFKKAYELCTLCEIEVCVIYYGPDGELKTWPEERQKVRDLALRYSQLNEAQRHNKSVDLYGFLNKKNDKEMNNQKKAKKTSLRNMNELKYPISDHYSHDQISQLIQSLELNISTLQERLRLVESQRQKETKLDHQSLNPMSLNHHDQTQSLNPSQFSLFMYNHGDATLSQIPLSASNFNQDFSELLQESGLTNHLMNQELCGYDQNMCMSDITNNNFQLASVSDIQEYSAFPVVQESGLENQLKQKELYGCDENMCLGNINNNDFQHPCVSNTEHYSEAQESVNNYELSQLIQHVLCGYDKNMCMTDITNNNSQHPCVSNTEHYSTEQESVDNYELNQFIQHEPCGYDQNTCMSDITNNNFQHPCVSNTEHYSMVQKSVNNYEMNQLMQHELCGYDQDMFTSDITNSNIPDPYISNRVSDELCSDFQDHYGNMLVFS